MTKHFDQIIIGAGISGASIAFELSQKGYKTLPDFYNPPEDKINPIVMFFPNNGYINDPQLSVKNIQQASELNGASFLFNSEKDLQISTMYPMTGFRFMTNPILMVFIWPSAPAATSTKTGRSSDRLWPGSSEPAKTDTIMNPGPSL
jgi:hypothetical protein